MKEEIMNDAIDDAMEDEGDEEERLLITDFIIHKYSLCLNCHIIKNY